MAAHLPHAHVAVPVRDGPIRRERFEADALQSVDRRDDNRQRWAVQRDEVRAVERMVARIVFAGTPRAELGLERIRQRRRQGDDRARHSDRDSPSRPTACRSRARRSCRRSSGTTRRSRRRWSAGRSRSTLPLTPTTALSRSNSRGHGGTRQVDLSGAKRGDDRRRQRLDVDFEADRQRRRRIDRRKGLVHAQHVGPQLFVAEGVEAEDRLAVSMCPLAVVMLLSIATVFSADPQAVVRSSLDRTRR